MNFHISGIVDLAHADFRFPLRWFRLIRQINGQFYQTDIFAHHWTSTSDWTSRRREKSIHRYKLLRRRYVMRRTLLHKIVPKPNGYMCSEFFNAPRSSINLSGLNSCGSSHISGSKCRSPTDISTVVSFGIK